jgi:hypothetical protein
MFDDLSTLLRNQDLYLEIPIRNLPNCYCSKSEISVLNFISIKEKFYGSKNIPMPKSVNGMLFTINSKLYFVQAEPYYESYKESPVENVLTYYFNNKIKEKVQGTVKTLSDIVQHQGEADDFTAFCGKKERNKIRSIILTELTERQYISMKIGLADEWQIRTDDSVLGEILLMNCSEFQDHFA